MSAVLVALLVAAGFAGLAVIGDCIERGWRR